MSRDKQIEEMAKALTNYEKKLCDRLPKDKCLLTSAIHAQVSCDYCKIAEFLVNAGYRKSTEVAEEIFAEIEETFKECLWFLENHPSDYPRMDRTKINVYKDNLQYIAEIKNKYKGE